jgi:hypothetical protein
MKKPRFETPDQIEAIAFRFMRAQCHRFGIQFRHFIENPDGHESAYLQYLAKWRSRGPVFILDNPVSLN